MCNVYINFEIFYSILRQVGVIEFFDDIEIPALKGSLFDKLVKQYNRSSKNMWATKG